MILGDFFKALAQIGDRRFRKVMALGIGLTIALLAAITIVLVFVLGLFLPDMVDLPFFGEVNWVSDVLSWAVVGLMVILSPFLMVPVAAAFTGIFLDEVAEAVEDRHYPGLPPATDVPILDGLRDASSLILVTIGVNIVALLLGIFIGPLAPILFWLVNGYLLGREYFMMAAIRREGLTAAKALRRKYTMQAWIAGTLMAVPLTVPIMNLFVPVLGAATFTHLYHRLTGTTS